MNNVKKCDRCGEVINGGLVYQGKDVNGNMHYLCTNCIIQRFIETQNDEQKALEVEDE